MATVLNIGRGPGNDLVIESRHVSAQHAQLIVDEDGQAFINDLGSSNGTFVNGKRISAPVQLERGDFVVLADSNFEWEKYVAPPKERAAPAPPPAPARKSSTLLAFTASLVVTLALALIFWGVNESAGAVVAEHDSAVAGGKDSGGNDVHDSSRGGTVNHTPNNTQHGGGANPDDGQGPGQGSTPSNPAVAQPKGEISYDFSCVISEENRDVASHGGVLDQIRTNTLENSGITVSVQEEMDYGANIHEQSLQGSTVLHNSDSRKIEGMLSNLVRHIPQPKGFTYQIFLIESEQLNAWTCGGRIYVTTTMYHFTKSDNELAGIIGHEIYHNELGHINKQLVASKYSEQTFGPQLGGVAATIDGIMHSPFGKKDEAACDFHGADLCVLAGYQPCDVVSLWDRMAQQEQGGGGLSEFASSHPLSSQRRDCLRNHLKVNYNLDCQ